MCYWFIYATYHKYDWFTDKLLKYLTVYVVGTGGNNPDYEIVKAEVKYAAPLPYGGMGYDIKKINAKDGAICEKWNKNVNYSELSKIKVYYQKR